ncbi:hypothetical protein AAVH_15454 [Aphelenchoides avenae]|nr:hypothetical protein AAVH_15454 [Aphelenchus avenae]
MPAWDALVACKAVRYADEVKKLEYPYDPQQQHDLINRLYWGGTLQTTQVSYGPPWFYEEHPTVAGVTLVDVKANK